MSIKDLSVVKNMVELFNRIYCICSSIDDVGTEFIDA